MKQLLTEDVHTQLREKGIINNDELVYQQGKVFIAVSTATGTTRVVDLPQTLLREGGNKRVLRG